MVQHVTGAQMRLQALLATDETLAQCVQEEIQDFGVGFDVDDVIAKGHGLLGMRERARLVGGRTIIKSDPGNGTRVFVELPMTRAPGEKALVNNGSNE